MIERIAKRHVRPTKSPSSSGPVGVLIGLKRVVSIMLHFFGVFGLKQVIVLRTERFS